MIGQNRGRFIVFEGIDGSGKTTQIARLKCRLDREGIPCASTREPTDGPVGRLLRQILTGAVITDERVAAPLFVADRLDHLLHPEYGICKTLAGGVSVLSDRYYFSSYAYQSAGDVPMERIIAANEECAEILRPTVTLFLDLTPEEAMRRIAAGRDHTELFETRERLAAVRENYFKAFTRLRDTENVIVVDGGLEEQALAREIWERIRVYF